MGVGSVVGLLAGREAGRGWAVKLTEPPMASVMPAKPMLAFPVSVETPQPAKKSVMVVMSTPARYLSMGASKKRGRQEPVSRGSGRPVRTHGVLLSTAVGSNGVEGPIGR